jgi:hypothetical protein
MAMVPMLSRFPATAKSASGPAASDGSALPIPIKPSFDNGAVDLAVAAERADPLSVD